MASIESSAPGALEFRMLGPLEVLAGGAPVRLGGPRQRAVLAILLGHANEVVPAGRLIDDVGDEPPETAANVLQGYASQLRRMLGRDVIATRGRDYAIRLAAASAPSAWARSMNVDIQSPPISLARPVAAPCCDRTLPTATGKSLE